MVKLGLGAPSAYENYEPWDFHAAVVEVVVQLWSYLDRLMPVRKILIVDKGCVIIGPAIDDLMNSFQALFCERFFLEGQVRPSSLGLFTRSFFS